MAAPKAASKKAIIHGKDHSRTYLKVKDCVLRKGKHKHLFPGKMETKIVPAMKKQHHMHFDKGDRVDFEIKAKNDKYIIFIAHALPIIGIAVGFVLGIIVVKDNVGMLLLMLLFMLTGVYMKRILYRRLNLHSQIDVNIFRHNAKVNVFRARKG